MFKAPSNTTPETLTAEKDTAVTRRSLRPRRGSLVAPFAGLAAAALLVTLASYANPVLANAQNAAGSTTATNAAPAVDVQAELLQRTNERADTRAEKTISQATAVINTVKGKVDTAPLISSVASLANYQYLDTTTVQTLTNTAVAVTTQAQAQAAAVDKAAADAAAAAAAEAAAAAAAAAAQEAAAAEAAAAAQASALTPDGARTVAAQMASSQYGWGDDQFQCLDSLWTKESGWNYQAENAGSGAFGIPQSLPGSKMASIADDWSTNAVTQISWGLDYIARGYGTPCSAWSHSQSVNWY
jgi:hypothetical protein